MQSQSVLSATNPARSLAWASTAPLLGAGFVTAALFALPGALRSQATAEAFHASLCGPLAALAPSAAPLLFLGHCLACWQVAGLAVLGAALTLAPRIRPPTR